MLLSDKYPFLTNYFEKGINNKLNNKGIPIAHSLLFWGRDLESQYIMAKEIARLLNCTGDHSDNCQCLNCRWIREDQHPAVLTISRLDNKPADDDTKTVISIKQSDMIKNSLMTTSEFYRVFIFCDKDEDGNIAGLNQNNFQAETANSLLKIIEEPQPGVTFIFLTRYIEDLLPTIISRSQCFFVPSKEGVNYEFGVIAGIFENYWNFERRDVFDISQRLADLTKEHSTIEILQSIQNYILSVLKSNPEQTEFINHIKRVEDAIEQARLGMKPINIFDDLCLKIIT